MVWHIQTLQIRLYKSSSSKIIMGMPLRSGTILLFKYSDCTTYVYQNGILTKIIVRLTIYILPYTTIAYYIVEGVAISPIVMQCICCVRSVPLFYRAICLSYAKRNCGFCFEFKYFATPVWLLIHNEINGTISISLMYISDAVRRQFTRNLAVRTFERQLYNL